MKKFLICLSLLFSFIFIGNVKALTTLDGQDFPDFPNKQYHHIIVERLNNNGYALLENSYGGNMYVDNGVIYNKNQSFKIYDLVDNSWIVRDSTNTAFSYNSIIATTVSIYSSSSLSSVSYSSGYNLFESPPFEMVFNDTSGYYKNGFYFNQSSLDYIWNQLFEGKSYNYYAGLNYNIIPSIYSSSIYFEPWKKEDFPNLACSYVNNSYFNCLFLEDLDNMNFSKDSNSYFTYSNSLNKYGNYPGFTFTTSTGEVRANTPSNSFFSFNNTYASSWYTNFDIINKDTGVTYKNKVFDYNANPQPNTFNFHLNGGHVYDDRPGFEFENWDDFSFTLYSNEVEDFITNLKVEKATMIFEGWYYDANFNNPFNITDNITSDVDLYAKFRYEKVDDFLNNTNFTEYTFDTLYNYAIITKGNNSGDIYLGINSNRYDITVYEYIENLSNYDNERGFCLVPIYSKNGTYYYLLDTTKTLNTEVLVLPKSTFENNDYKFLLTDNAYVTYTNNLEETTIYDSNGNQINTNLEETYQKFQDSMISEENDLLTIFKNLTGLKDNNIFNNINSLWNKFKGTPIYNYLMILIVGSLIILIIKAAKRK